MRLFSPAKLNLFFRVLSKRSDGYHETASLVQTIDLGDFLSLEIIEGGDTLTSTHPSLPCNSSNLILRAANLFRKKTGDSFGVRAHLDKRIPMEAGLGGGSSNAATTLFGLNALRKTKVEEKELQQWASELGSDPPLFFSKGTAYCTGRGEMISDLSPIIPLRGWIAKPVKGLCTASVYEKFAPQKVKTSLFFNDLEPAAIALMPELLELKKRLFALGFEQVCMTGSGSAFFCLGQVSAPLLPGVYFIPFQSIFRTHWYEFP